MGEDEEVTHISHHRFIYRDYMQIAYCDLSKAIILTYGTSLRADTMKATKKTANR